MFKNMDFHRYVAKKDFFFQNTSFENHKLQIEIRKNATLLFMENEIMNKNNGLSARLYVFVCTPGTWLVSAHLARAFYIREFKI